MAGVRVVEAPREIKSFPYFMAWHPRLTNEPAHNGFVNNCGRLFGPSEQFEADIVELGLNGFCVNGRES